MKKLKTGINKLVRRCVMLSAFLLFMSSCASSVTLPAYQPILPDKPELEEMPEVSEEAYRNIVKLMAYAEEQNLLLENWQMFYNELKLLY